jgi:hypothetical protein
VLQVGFFDEKLRRYTKVARKSKPPRHTIDLRSLSAAGVLPHVAAGGFL